jgi:DNA replication protein DnaC
VSISATSTPKLCVRCKTREREEGRAYCAECFERFDRAAAERDKRHLAQLRADYPPWRVEVIVDEHNRAAIAELDRWPLSVDQDDDEPEDFIGGAFIWGNVGTGKTTLAYHVAERWVTSRAENARFVIVRDLLAQAKLAMTRLDRSSPIDELLEERPDLLVLDDLGAERPTEWAVEEIARIVEARYREEWMPTIVMSNYSPSQLAKRLGRFDQITGQRIVSRLREASLVIELDGPDRRLQRSERAA